MVSSNNANTRNNKNNNEQEELGVYSEFLTRGDFSLVVALLYERVMVEPQYVKEAYRKLKKEIERVKREARRGLKMPVGILGSFLAEYGDIPHIDLGTVSSALKVLRNKYTSIADPMYYTHVELEGQREASVPIETWKDAKLHFNTIPEEQPDYKRRYEPDVRDLNPRMTKERKTSIVKRLSEFGFYLSKLYEKILGLSFIRRYVSFKEFTDYLPVVTEYSSRQPDLILIHKDTREVISFEISSRYEDPITTSYIHSKHSFFTKEGLNLKKLVIIAPAFTEKAVMYAEELGVSIERFPDKFPVVEPNAPSFARRIVVRERTLVPRDELPVGLVCGYRAVLNFAEHSIYTVGQLLDLHDKAMQGKEPERSTLRDIIRKSPFSRVTARYTDIVRKASSLPFIYTTYPLAHRPVARFCSDMDVVAREYTRRREYYYHTRILRILGKYL